MLRRVSRALLLFVAIHSSPLGFGTSGAGNTALSRDGPRYLTLNIGERVDLSPGPVKFESRPHLLRKVGSRWEFRAVESGHVLLSVGAGERKSLVVVFVCPTPSRQVGRPDLDWYRTQFGSGLSDCGPASVAMSILWARGQDVGVRRIRAEIGFPLANGAVRPGDLREALGKHEVASRFTAVSAVRDLIAVLKRAHLAVALIRSGLIERVKGDPRRNLVGRYYDYDGGHYVLVKGYSLDGNYFVVYDPYPVDWDDNLMRYEDGQTMIGKNRYYPARQVLAALKTPGVLEVLR